MHSPVTTPQTYRWFLAGNHRGASFRALTDVDPKLLLRNRPRLDDWGVAYALSQGKEAKQAGLQGDYYGWALRWASTEQVVSHIRNHEHRINPLGAILEAAITLGRVDTEEIYRAIVEVRGHHKRWDGKVEGQIAVDAEEVNRAVEEGTADDALCSLVVGLADTSGLTDTAARQILVAANRTNQTRASWAAMTVLSDPRRWEWFDAARGRDLVTIASLCAWGGPDGRTRDRILEEFLARGPEAARSYGEYFGRDLLYTILKNPSIPTELRIFARRWAGPAGVNAGWGGELDAFQPEVEEFLRWGNTEAWEAIEETARKRIESFLTVDVTYSYSVTRWPWHVLYADRAGIEAQRKLMDLASGHSFGGYFRIPTWARRQLLERWPALAVEWEAEPAAYASRQPADAPDNAEWEAVYEKACRILGEDGEEAVARWVEFLTLMRDSGGNVSELLDVFAALA